MRPSMKAPVIKMVFICKEDFLVSVLITAPMPFMPPMLTENMILPIISSPILFPKAGKQQENIPAAKIMRAILNKERGIKLEGSFGNDKNHYLLQKVNARK